MGDHPVSAEARTRDSAATAWASHSMAIEGFRRAFVTVATSFAAIPLNRLGTASIFPASLLLGHGFRSRTRRNGRCRPAIGLGHKHLLYKHIEHGNGYNINAVR